MACISSKVNPILMYCFFSVLDVKTNGEEIPHLKVDGVRSRDSHSDDIFESDEKIRSITKVDAVKGGMWSILALPYEIYMYKISNGSDHSAELTFVKQATSFDNALEYCAKQYKKVTKKNPVLCKITYPIVRFNESVIEVKDDQDDSEVNNINNINEVNNINEENDSYQTYLCVFNIYRQCLTFPLGKNKKWYAKASQMM